MTMACPTLLVYAPAGRYNSGMRKACVLAMIAVAAMAQQPEKFYSVIRENNLTQLKAMLDQKGSANVADDRGITPLMYAAEIGRWTPCAC